jgi:cytochrome c
MTPNLARRHGVRASMTVTQCVAYAVVTTCLLQPVTTLADAGLARERHCLNCHAEQRKMVGPSLRDISARYRGSGDAVVPALAAKVRQGGSGAWGAVAMPSHPQVTQAEAERLVRWVLAHR